MSVDKKTTALPGGLASPARRALDAAGINHLEDLAALTEAELGALHGIGPKALDLLRSEMKQHGLAFARPAATGAKALPARADIKSASGVPGKESLVRSPDPLGQLFASLKELLLPYAPPLSVMNETPRRIDLVSVKPLVIEGRKRTELYFASLIIQKDYVGFYFMPVYGAPEMKVLFAPRLLGLLKGKSCFHIRRLDDELREQVRQALQEGFSMYQKRGWV